MRKPLWWVIACGLILSSPVLVTGFPGLTHDGRVHEVWYTNFAAQFWAGDLYPRWLANLDMGLGGPTFFFYPPTPFFITSLFQPIFPAQPHGWYVLGLSVAIALSISGVAAYAWLRETVDERSAAIAAILYMALPYHFAVDIFLRGAFGEVWAFVWMPLILWAAQRLTKRATVGAAIGLALSYAGLITTHLPTTLLFSVIPPIWVLWASAPGARIRAFAWVSVSMAIGIGLSAIYLVPALRDQASVTMDAMRVGDFHYSKTFFLPRDAHGKLLLARNTFQRGLFWIAVATAAVGGCAAIAALRGGDERPVRRTIFWSVVVVASGFMMFPVSTPVFELVPALQLIQFPWRFQAILGLAVIALAAEGLGAIARRRDALDTRLLVVGGILVFQWMLFAVTPLSITAFGTNRQLTETSPWKARNTNTAEYRPHWATASMAPLQKRLRGDGDTIPKVAVTIGSARVTRWKPRDIAIQFDAPSNALVEVRQFYYPAWHATLDEKTRIAIAPADSTGLIQLPIPAGSHSITLRLEKGPSEILGGRISSVSLALLVIIGVAALFRTRGGRGREVSIHDHQVLRVTRDGMVTPASPIA